MMRALLHACLGVPRPNFGGSWTALQAEVDQAVNMRNVSEPQPAIFVYDSLPERFRHPAAQSSSARARLEYRLSTLFSTSRNRAMTASDASLFYIPLYPEALCEAQNATSGCARRVWS